MVLGYKGPTELERLYREHPEQNIKAALAPAFESQPTGVSTAWIASRYRGAPDSSCFQAMSGSPRTRSPSELRRSSRDRFKLSRTFQARSAGCLRRQRRGIQPTSCSSTYMRAQTRRDQPELVRVVSRLLSRAHEPRFLLGHLAMDSLSNVIPRWQGWARRRRLTKLAPTEAAYPFPEPTPTIPRHRGPEVPSARRRSERGVRPVDSGDSGAHQRHAGACASQCGHAVGAGAISPRAASPLTLRWEVITDLQLA